MRSNLLKHLELLREQRKRQVTDSFYEFVKDAFAIIDPETTYIDNWHVKYICDLLQSETHRIRLKLPKTKDIIINVPPRSLKSIIVSQCWPAWAWIHAPHLKFICSSYASNLSIQHSVACRRIIESDWYQEKWGELFKLAKDQDTKTHFENDKYGVRISTSTGSGITGSGADIIISDDPMNPQQAASEKERETANNYTTGTLATRLNNQEIGLRVVIMQRLHEHDTTGHILVKSKDKYFHVCIPAKLNEHVKPIEIRNYYDLAGFFSPIRFTQLVLDSLKLDLGSYRYANEYDQSPAPEEGGILKKAWFKYIDKDKLPAGLIWDFFLDTAYTEDKKNDPSAVLAATWHDGLLYVKNSTAIWKEFPELIKFIPEYILKHGYVNASRVMVEPKATGKSIVQTLRGSINIIELPPPVDSKIVRVNNRSAIIEAGKVILVNDEWNEGFVHECAVFPNGAHDDQLDNLINAIDHYTVKKFRPKSC